MYYASLKTFLNSLMSSLDNLSTMNQSPQRISHNNTDQLTRDKYTVVWKREKKPGFISTQKVTVFGIDAVQCVIEEIVPNDTNWDVYCN